MGHLFLLLTCHTSAWISRADQLWGREWAGKTIAYLRHSAQERPAFRPPLPGLSVLLTLLSATEELMLDGWVAGTPTD